MARKQLTVILFVDVRMQSEYSETGTELVIPICFFRTSFVRQAYYINNIDRYRYRHTHTYTDTHSINKFLSDVPKAITFTS